MPTMQAGSSEAVETMPGKPNSLLGKPRPTKRGADIEGDHVERGRRGQDEGNTCTT